MPKLSIDIGVNLSGDAANTIKELSNAFEALNNNVSRLSSSLQASGIKPLQDIAKAAGGAATSNRQLAQTNKAVEESFNRVRNSANNTTSSYTSFSQSQDALRRTSNLAGLSLINVGRVVQDLPFGLLGIANNITPLAEGFKQLSDAAKASGQSLGTALLNSLKGSGGVILAFSAVTAALSFASVGLSYWTRISREAKDENDKFADSLKKVKAEAYTTGINIQNLINQAGDSTIGIDAQREAFYKAKEELAKYNYNLTEADIKNGKATEAVNKLTLALIQQSIAQKNSERLGDLFSRLNDAQKEQLKNVNALSKAETDYANFKRDETVRTANSTEINLKNARKAYNESSALVLLLKGQINETTAAGSAASKLASEYLKGIRTPQENLSRIEQLNNLIEVQKRKWDEIKLPYSQAKSQYDAITRQIKLYEAELDNIRGKESATGKSTSGISSVPKTFIDSLKEIQDDIAKIQEDPLLKNEEKDLKVIARIKEGLDYLRDSFKGEFLLNLKDPTGAVNQLRGLLSSLQISVYGSKAKDEFAQLEEKLKTISETADILGTDRLPASINEVEGLIARLIEIKRNLAAQPIDEGQFDNYANTLILIIELIDKLKNKLGGLGKEKGDEERVKALRNFGIEIDGLKEDIISANNTKLYPKSYTDSLEKSIDAQKKIVSKYRGEIDKEFKLSRGEETALIGTYKSQLKKEEQELNRQLAQMNLVEGLNQALDNIGQAVNTAIIDIFSNLGELGGSGGKKVFGGIFASLIETIGKELIKFGVVALKVNEAIKKIKETIFAGGTIGIVAALGAIALGAALVASAKAGKKSLGFAKGGFVSGDGNDTSDSVPARLSNGEYVVRAASVRKYGVGFMDSINQGAFKRFNNGGLVFGTNWRALVNRMGTPGLELGPQPYRALVNRPMTNNGGYIAETIIKGQDLKLVLSRADKRFNSVTS